MAGLFGELKRRNVFKVGTAYIVLSWLLAQAADLAADTFDAPDWVMKMLVTLLALLFPLVLFFAWAYEITPEGIKKEKDVDRTQSITQKTGRKLDFVIIGVLLVALGYFVWESRFEVRDDAADSLAADQTDIAGMAPAQPCAPPSKCIPAQKGSLPQNGSVASDQTDPITPKEPAPALIDPKSIAVLPFVNMSPDPEQEYFSDGIAEEILNALARVEELKVAGRTSSFAFKGQNQDLKLIGQALRVANILEGSVRKAGNKLRITAQLIKVDDGFHLWSETYDRDMDDIFAIQDEISQAILVQLKAKLLGNAAPVATEQANPQAYAQYLLAKQRIYERTQASLELAADLLKQAIQTDPGFAAAHAQLGIATILLSEEDYGSLPNEQALSEGLAQLQTALSMAPAQAEALAGMGLYHGNQPGGVPEAITWLERALVADPNQPNASNWLANYLRQSGRISEALALRERDFARDPLYMPVFSNLVQLYVAGGETQKAQQVLDQLRPYLHDDANMLMTEGSYYQVTGQWAKADRAFTAAYEKEPRNFVNQGWLCATLTETGQYQRCADLDSDTQAALALSRLGQSEEGLMRGHAAASKGQYPTPYFQALVENGRHRELVQFVEARWSNLAALQRDFPEGDGWGAWNMGFVAEAYAGMGNEAKFSEALQLARASNDAQLSAGADNWSLSWSRAHLAVLDGQHEEAITLMERAVEQGLVFDLTAPSAWPSFKPLRGDPHFEATLTRMLEHLNAERAELGLEPLTT
jgi:TolB-like protein/lipopolysaccharide biosynthesis regulator YciM